MSVAGREAAYSHRGSKISGESPLGSSLNAADAPWRQHLPWPSLYGPTSSAINLRSTYRRAALRDRPAVWRQLAAAPPGQQLVDRSAVQARRWARYAGWTAVAHELARNIAHAALCRRQPAPEDVELYRRVVARQAHLVDVIFDASPATGANR